MDDGRRDGIAARPGGGMAIPDRSVFLATAESVRLAKDGPAWRRWGPYLSERAWGTVREDYSPDGDAWSYFPFDQARSRAYRWNEDGIGGISDDRQRLCFALALWNGRDPILKERLFGLTNHQGNHGEDVKECYFFLDSTPTHSYMKMLYRYPQREFPYADLIAVNGRRSRMEPEYELLDTGVFQDDRFFDVEVEYAKAAPDDILVRLTATNRGPEAAELHLLPTLWFRNTWSWSKEGASSRGLLRRVEDEAGAGGRAVRAEHPALGAFRLAAEGTPALLFTENETNVALLYGAVNPSPYAKDAFHDAVVRGRPDAVNPAGTGTKAAAHYRFALGPGEARVVRLRLSAEGGPAAAPGKTKSRSSAETWLSDHDAIFLARRSEADAFYAALQPALLSEEERMIERRALAGLLWSKQFYHYDVQSWLLGDPAQPPPPPQRLSGRNREWAHLNSADILSMPDTWEYPWFASWDLAFHCLPLALVDPEFAKNQLVKLGREWYQHPNGQVPAYEWDFGDVNPPVMAWAAWRVYQIDRKGRGARDGDLVFLERVFHKLLLNFVWWVNRKDAGGRNIFQGGFLGLDNIGLFDRDAAAAEGLQIEQADGTAWMGMFSLNMMTIALELALRDRVYEDIATKFFEHFLSIAAALNDIAGQGIAIWDDEDEFFYDVLKTGPGRGVPLKVRSAVGLIPLFAVTTIEPALLDKLPEFKRRLQWFLDHRPGLAGLVSHWQVPGSGERRLMALCRGHRMKRVLSRMLDEKEFLSPHGVRALSRVYADRPYVFRMDGRTHTVRYEPAESESGFFGGNSNWRGPVWFPINYLIIEALQQFHHYYGDDFKVESPTGSGRYLTLNGIADDLSRRLIGLFLRRGDGRRPVFGGNETLQKDPLWRDLPLFYEYFHGDNGAGLGASHQTGWTGLVAKLIQQQGERR
jgi:hypothetical protein